MEWYGNWRKCQAPRHIEEMQCDLLLAAITNPDKRNKEPEQYQDEVLDCAQLLLMVTGEKLEDLYTPKTKWENR